MEQVFKLEICVDSIESALIAQEAGAHRIELCSALALGGLTPSAGLIAAARSNLTIEIYVLIRPRSSDFLYTDPEFRTMLHDIEMCGELGINGIVTGLLTAEGRIDIERTARLAEAAAPMSVTFHRAFDLCMDPMESLEDVISTGAVRLLTSGQRNKAAEGTELIGRLVNRAGKRLIIMPGSGLNDTNILKVAKSTGATEFHMSASKTINSEMKFRSAGITMGTGNGDDEYNIRIPDIDKIIKVLDILKMI